jgi:hypothetical protein
VKAAPEVAILIHGGEKVKAVTERAKGTRGLDFFFFVNCVCWLGGAG